MRFTMMMPAKLLVCVTLMLVWGYRSAHAYNSCLQFDDKDIYPKNETFCCKNQVNNSHWNVFRSVNIKLTSSKSISVTIGTDENLNGKMSKSWLQILYSLFSIFKSSKEASRDYEETKKLSPYKEQQVCITSGGEKVHMNVRMEIEPYFLMFFIIGLILFFSAKRLSTSMSFYYSSSIGFGVLCSLLLVVFIVSRYVPKKPVAYSILLGGWGICALVFNVIYSNIEFIILTYKFYVFCYVVAMGFISFAICYWYGPVENIRTQNLVQWFLQIIALAFLYNSSQKVEVSLSFITALLAVYIVGNNSFPILNYVPIKKLLFKLPWYKHERKLLTNEEYREEGLEETKKALEELREFCNSPQCSPWKTMSRIQNPQKFVSFVEGSSHVDDAEETLYENDVESEESDSNISSDCDSIITGTGTEEINSTNNEIKEENGEWIKENISEDEDSLVGLGKST